MGGSGVSLISVCRSSSPRVCLPEKSLKASRHCVWVLIGQGQHFQTFKGLSGLEVVENFRVAPCDTTWGYFFFNTRENGVRSKPKQAFRESRRILGYRDQAYGKQTVPFSPFYPHPREVKWDCPCTRVVCTGLGKWALKLKLNAHRFLTCN